MTIDEIRSAVNSALLVADNDYNPDNKADNVSIVEEIRKVVSDMADGGTPSPEHIAKVAVATNKNVQVRDFIMGLRQELDYRFIGQYLQYITELIKKDYAAPLATVLTTYFYEAGDTEQSKELLQQVLEVDPEYSLAKLLERVYLAEWPGEAMASMAKELHQKVVDGIYETNSDVEY